MWLRFIMLFIVCCLLFPFTSFSENGEQAVTLGENLVVKYSSNQGSAEGLPLITVANTYIPNGGTNDFSFASFEFSSNNGGVSGQFFSDGSGYFLNGTPNIYFRASTNHPILLGTNNTVRMILTNTGNVGIGTTQPTNKLDVNGGIGCKELTVLNYEWADFVFKDDYKLLDLNEVEKFIRVNKHLPGIPSESKIRGTGLSVGEISGKLLQKIEELTLYMIELKKENENLKEMISKK